MYDRTKYVYHGVRASFEAQNLYVSCPLSGAPSINGRSVVQLLGINPDHVFNLREVVISIYPRKGSVHVKCLAPQWTGNDRFFESYSSKLGDATPMPGSFDKWLQQHNAICFYLSAEIEFISEEQAHAKAQ